MAALMFAQVPRYSALIVRRNFTDLKLPGGLIDRSLEWLSPFVKSGRTHWNAQENRWRFKEGGTLQFGYADKEGDERRYDGSEHQFIGLDEGVQFTEKQIIYFVSERIRRQVGIHVPLRFRVATTPGGISHSFLKKRYINPGTPGKVYIRATVKDNPSVDQAEYEESLAELKTADPLRYRQMLLGDWDAVAGGRFQRQWFGWWRREGDQTILTNYDGEEVERFDASRCGRFQTCDPAASTSAAADYFVHGTFTISPRANVVWTHLHRDKHEIQEQVTTCQRLYRMFRPQFVAVEMVLNQRALGQLLQRSTNPVMVVKPVSPLGKDKLNHAAGFIALAASKRIFLPETQSDPWPEAIDELVRFTGTSEDEHDDVCDVGSFMADVLPFVRPGFNPGTSSKPPIWHQTKESPLA